MINRTLIILYGGLDEKAIGKQQRMIDGRASCGYREYAKNFGHIIYLVSQTVRYEWEHSITNPKDVINFIAKYPNSIVWSVKYSPEKDRKILSKIINRKVYYSCNAKNRYNGFCNVSLVDTEDRTKNINNARVWFKGKDPEYWKPSENQKEFDYILVGARGDKNEVYFLNRLNEIKDKRNVLWVGGKKFERLVETNHNVVFTDFVGQNQVRDYINKSKIGILFTELKVEGFPQSFLEMTMCGVPVVYNKDAPINKYYYHEGNCVLSSKKDIVKSAEGLLKNLDSKICRQVAVDNYSIEKSYQGILECLK